MTILVLMVAAMAQSVDAEDVNLGPVGVGVGFEVGPNDGAVGGGSGTANGECDPLLGTSCSAAAAIGYGGCFTVRADVVLNYLPDGEVEAEACVSVAMAAAAGAVWHLHPLRCGEFYECAPGNDPLKVVPSTVTLNTAASLWQEDFKNEDDCFDKMAGYLNSKYTWEEVEAACETSIQEKATDTDLGGCSTDTFYHVETCVQSSQVDAPEKACVTAKASAVSEPAFGGEPTDGEADGESIYCNTAGLNACFAITIDCGDLLLPLSQPKPPQDWSPEQLNGIARAVEDALWQSTLMVEKTYEDFCSQQLDETRSTLCTETTKLVVEALKANIITTMSDITRWGNE